MNPKLPRPPCKHCGKPTERRDNQYCPVCIKKRVFNTRQSLQQCMLDSTRRKWLVRKHGNKCFVCKVSDWREKPLNMEIDHIDGNSQNNEESNLRLICPNCHAQTPTYKNKNRGKGRHARTVRRAAGKSY